MIESEPKYITFDCHATLTRFRMADLARDILRYDLMAAHDMGVKHKAFARRGPEPSTPYYEHHEVDDIGGVATLPGL